MLFILALAILVAAALHSWRNDVCLLGPDDVLCKYCGLDKPACKIKGKGKLSFKTKLLFASCMVFFVAGLILSGLIT